MRTNFKSFPIIVAVLSLSACASISRSEFAGDVRHSDLRTAALSTKPIGHVEYGNGRNIKIGMNSPLMVGESLKGRFEVVSLQGVRGQPYALTVLAICDCLGFRKWTVVPDAYLLDHEGMMIAQGAIISPTHRHITGVFPRDGEYKVLVMADATHEGEKVGSIRAWLPGGGLTSSFLDIPKRSHPTGIVQVSYPKAAP